MFTLVTGVPGSGKTLWVVNHLKDGVKLPNSEELRKVYYFGIPDVSPTLGWILLDDPFNWHEQVEDGSIVVIDECQEHFPVRDHKKPVPAGLQAIERHRYRGLDLFFMTQHPSLLDHHARRLAGQHCHLNRNFGAAFSVLYRANACMNDPTDYHTLQKAEKTTFKHPKNTFGLYKSAEVHTHKFRIPKLLYVLVFLIALVIFAVNYGYQTLFGDESRASQIANASPAASTLSNFSGSLVPNNSGKKLDINSFLPAIPNIPASSEYYQSQWKPKSIPIVSSCIGTDKHCRCYTQQGTKVLVSHDYCVSVLANGSTFDHTLPDLRLSRKQNKHTNETNAL